MNNFVIVQRWVNIWKTNFATSLSYEEKLRFTYVYICNLNDCDASTKGSHNAGSPSLGYISVNNLKWNKADQGRCLCFLGSLHSDKCRLKFIEKRLDLKIVQNILSIRCGIVQILSGL